MTDEISMQLTLQINLIHWMLNAVCFDVSC